MLSIRTYAGTILVVKNSEVTIIFPYKVMETVYSLKVCISMDAGQCVTISLVPSPPTQSGNGASDWLGLAEQEVM